MPFSRPYLPERSIAYANEVLRSRQLAGDLGYTKRCQSWLESRTGAPRALLTSSGTHSLELSALLAEIRPGDEVILPSFTFSSTANAFVLRGARICFVDIRPDTMNLDETRVEQAVNSKTRAIVPVHYGGVGCEMETLVEIARSKRLLLIEDAAQALLATYKGKALGTFGELGCLSFHETKNYTSGEGGALLVNSDDYLDRAEIIREKGTNRSQFFRGQVAKYSWLDVGSSFLVSDLNAALLYGQFEIAQEILKKRLDIWNFYREALTSLEETGRIGLPTVPSDCVHNGHVFYVKARDLEERSALLEFLRSRGIGACFHYVPLHSSAAGKKFGYFHGVDRHTTQESERLVRLPLFFELTPTEMTYVCDGILSFYEGRT
ncbi:MAG: dTDP-4-amino-4,6-dideoxygalactose transaminase [Bdellovibrionales bacterium]|nr:dTDP-4-amino-4,6-dideoxygalactose transaminase [Bdellovibrionales bacterium]